VDITNIVITGIDLPNSTLAATVRGSFDTHDHYGVEARLDFLYVAYRSDYRSTLDMTLLDGTDLVANDVFDYSDELFGYVPAQLDHSDWIWKQTGTLLFLEADFHACEKALRAHCDAALEAADEASKVAYLHAMRDRLTSPVSQPVQ
jgi:hypothetical protein